MIFSVHALDSQFYTEAIFDMISPLNTYVIIYKSEISLKFYATVFPLAHRILYLKKKTIFFNPRVYSVVCKKSLTHVEGNIQILTVSRNPPYRPYTYERSVYESIFKTDYQLVRIN